MLEERIFWKIDLKYLHILMERRKIWICYMKNVLKNFPMNYKEEVYDRSKKS